MSSEGPRPLVSKLVLQNQQINGMFEQVLKEFISTVFKPETLVPGIQAYSRMLSVDAKWDVDPRGPRRPYPSPPKGDKIAGSIDNDDDEDEDGPNENKSSKVGSFAAPR
ncbi:hypothetical protein BG015_003548 [Linnemannia schmuckeri]|uniref:Uncharacterized protein n=1 Tax=Linnemannia schmuckeri TaxID=64567 RepID=A0A9P5RLY0_9FUNG|nr:hypothetical protein BG015_003548 [Linnemannia schmuckeri]